jgi:two-component system sensor histidine kinase PilS (NtrC family)
MPEKIQKHLGAGNGRDRTLALARQQRWLILVRVLVVGTLVLSTWALGGSSGVGFAVLRSEATEAFLYGLAVGGALVNVAYGVCLWLWTDARQLVLLAYVQVTGDVVLAGGLVLVTGGPVSAFSLFFSLVIIEGAVLLYRSGAFYAASLCVGALFYIGLGEVGLAPEPELLTTIRKGQEIKPREVLAAEDEPARWSGLTYGLINQSLAFYGVAFLASSLATSLRRQSGLVAALEARHEQVLQSVGVGILTLLERGRGYANPAAQAILDLTTPEPSQDDLSRVAPELLALLEARADGQEELVLSRPAGERRVVCRISGLVDELGQPLGRLAVLDEVTDLRQLQGEVARTSRLALLGEVATRMAVQLRNPLASISGALQVLEQGGQRAGGHAERLSRIVEREIGVLDHWIEDFLAFAVPGQGERRPVDLGAVLEAAVVAARARVGPAIEVEVGSYTTLWAAGSGAQLDRVLAGVVDNALGAMQEGGKLTCELCEVERDGRPMARLSVRDTGPGLTPEVAQRVFEPFFTTRYGHAGLGLAVARRLCEAWGGQIHLESAPGQGTTAVIELPLLRAAEVTAQASAS